MVSSYYLTQYVSCTLKGLINVLNVEFSKYQDTSQGIISLLNTLYLPCTTHSIPTPRKESPPQDYFFLLPQRITLSLYCIIGFIVGNLQEDGSRAAISLLGDQ